MQTLLSVPENIVSTFNQLEAGKGRDYFVVSDPPGRKVGSGGGTAWLLAEHFASSGSSGFENYLSSEKKIIIHAGGQSRRLPAYAPSGKVLTPIPVFRWSRGQRLDQTLLDLQLPLYERLMEISSGRSNTLVASGDVLVQYNKLPAELPDADVVCLGIWVEPHLASRHGVFFTPKNNPAQLDFMLQKPSHRDIENLSASHLFMMDVGVWLLSDRAVGILMDNCGWNGMGFDGGSPSFYDLYSSFGTCLGHKPSIKHERLNDLSVALVPLEKADFYHYGTSEELISSTEKIQNVVKDQRAIWHNRVKPHPSLFVQNAATPGISWGEENHHIWIENSVVPDSWKLSHHHVITGVPENRWSLTLCPGICVDVVRIDEEFFCFRPYHMNDKFSGESGKDGVVWLGVSLRSWLKSRGISFEEAKISAVQDIQEVKLFPLIKKDDLSGNLLAWMIGDESHREDMKQRWLSSERLSASEISSRANLLRLYQQRRSLRQQNLIALSKNYQHSVFYQADLSQVAGDFVRGRLSVPEVLDGTESPPLQFRNLMLRSEIFRQLGSDGRKMRSKPFLCYSNRSLIPYLTGRSRS